MSLPKTFDPELELRVLRSATVSARRLSVLRRAGGSALFNLPAARKIYDRADKVLKIHGEVPSWRDLMSDPSLSQEVRERAAAVKAKPIKKLKTLRQCSDRLAEFSRIRVAFEAARDVGEYIRNSEGIDPDVLTDMLAKAASKSRKVQDEEIYRHVGLGGKRPRRDGTMVLSDLMKRGKNSFIPTGLKAFDTRSVGLPRTALVSIAGQSGGGKSTLADTIRTNAALLGYRANMWSLEQDHEEMEMRLLARLTGINMEKFLRPKQLQESEKRRIKKCYDKFIDDVLDHNGFTSTAVPRGGVTMMDILENDESFGYDITFIDYISLLEDADSEEQWKALGNAARQGKVNAGKNKKVIVVLAQLGEDERVRYAKAIKEHCLTGDTLIDTVHGLVPISKLAAFEEKQFGVMTHEGMARTSKIHNNGIKQVYEVSTQSGFSVKATIEHRLLVRKDGKDEWKHVSRLKAGDQLVLKANDQWPTKLVELETPAVEGMFSRSRQYALAPAKMPKRMSPQLARVIGYLLGDGMVTPKRTTFTNNSLELVNDYVACFKAVFGFEPTVYKAKTYYQVNCYRQQVMAFLSQFEGLIGKSHEKYIPDQILQSPRHVIGNCIGAYYDCDGHASTDKKEVTSVSREMLRRLQIVLTKVGIYSAIKTTVLRNKNHRDQHKLVIAGIDNLVKWYGFVIHKHPTKQVRHKTAWKKFNRDYTLQEVTSVTKLGRERVYDLTVPGPHSYVANGIISHNCNNMWTWMYGDRERATHMIKITQQKARNQPVYDIILREEFEYNRFRDPTDNELRDYERSQTNNKTNTKSKISDYSRNKRS